MGTALTERQLRELNRLTKRLFLCFDADAAGQEETLRGMELAVSLGFDVRSSTLPKGTDPADDPVAFSAPAVARELSGASRATAARAGGTTRTAAERRRSRRFSTRCPDSPEHQDARRLVTDLLDLPPEYAGGVRADPGRTRAQRRWISPRLLDAGFTARARRANGVAAHPKLVRYLEELGPEHFDDELHRHAETQLLGQVSPSRMTCVCASLLRSRSVSSIRRMKVPPVFRAKSQLNSAVRAPPTWR